MQRTDGWAVPRVQRVVGTLQEAGPSSPRRAEAQRAETGELRSPTYSPAGCAGTAQNAVGEYGAATNWVVCKKEGPTPQREWAQKCAGGDVLSHRVPPAVPSALQSLTTVFEMGTGVSSALRPPATSIEAVKQASSK